MARIFVSYRRQDSAGHAGRIYDRLRAFFGSGRVFMDVEGIDLGADFTKELDERIVGAEVVIAVIGPHWISASAPDGQRRLSGESDYVRYELATALARRIEVIPVLVAGAEAPSADELPEALADLANLQMYVISDVAMDTGMARLIRGVE
ncbi:MAG: toll/interleukin-1 receptor domain-containing protein, partial [Planctomycetota bacterium]